MKTPVTDEAYGPGDIYGDSADRVSRLLIASQKLEIENIQLRAALKGIGEIEFGLNKHSPAQHVRDVLETLK